MQITIFDILKNMLLKAIKYFSLSRFVDSYNRTGEEGFLS